MLTLDNCTGNDYKKPLLLISLIQLSGGQIKWTVYEKLNKTEFEVVVWVRAQARSRERQGMGL